MSPLSRTLICLLPLLTLAPCARAQDTPVEQAIPDAIAPEYDQAVYKGVVGNLLDAIPMDPAKRVDLQRFNAVVGNTASARSLAVLAGLSNPVFMAVGLIWGIFAAANIKPVIVVTKPAAVPDAPSGEVATKSQLVAAPAPPPSVIDPRPENEREHGIVPAAATAVVTASLAIDPAPPRPAVIKIWLPRGSMQTQ